MSLNSDFNKIKYLTNKLIHKFKNQNKWPNLCIGFDDHIKKNSTQNRIWGLPKKNYLYHPK